MKWISVKDKLPDKEGEYLVYVEEFNSDTFHGFSYLTTITNFEKRIVKTVVEDDKIIHFLSKDMDFSINESDRDIKVTHWIPLPLVESPKEKKDD